MKTLNEAASHNQAAHSPENSSEIQPRRKIGQEIVRSVNLASNFYKKFNAATDALDTLQGAPVETNNQGRPLADDLGNMPLFAGTVRK